MTIQMLQDHIESKINSYCNHMIFQIISKLTLLLCLVQDNIDLESIKADQFEH